MNANTATLEASAGARALFLGLLALGLVLIYAPAAYLLLASFNPGMQLGLVPPTEFSLNWYRSLLGDRKLLSALSESIVVGLGDLFVFRIPQIDRREDSAVDPRVLHRGLAL